MTLSRTLAVGALAIAASGVAATAATAHCRPHHRHLYRSSYRHAVVERRVVVVSYRHRPHRHHWRSGYAYGYGYGYAPYTTVDYFDGPYAYDYGWAPAYYAAPVYYEPPFVIGYSGYGGGWRGRGHWDHGRHGGDGPHWHGR